MKSLLALCVSIALCGSVAAKPLADLKEITNKNNQIEIKTDAGERLQLTLINSNTLRVWASADQTLVPADNKKAAIVTAPTQDQVTYTLLDKGDYRLLTTSAFALRIYSKPLRFEAYHRDNLTPYFKELKPVDLGHAQTSQTLSADPDEFFYGGGQQNGQFEFNGKTLEVSYSGGWEEGDRPSPAPFYMSSKGYGVLRNTWSDGQYDFRSDGYLSTTHQEARFDAYYFFGDSIKPVLAQYTQLTGRAPLLPRWAFEYGDADCYNDGDNVKKPGTVPEHWSDGPTGTTIDVLETIAAKYRQHDMPGGWILPNDGYGCGYTDLPNVVAGLQQYGFKTGLWTEDGVDKIAWEVGTAGTRAQKLDVAWTGKGYQFALDANHDAAQGILDNSDSRPFLWTVMGWAGIQRYAVTWTGDQSGSWDYIRWHIPTLIGSGLSGQVYATGDVDGIFGGSPETYTRDLQWKSFTPVLMGMSGWSKTARKHPWWFDEPYRSINRRYLKLKMRLMPYMYTLAHQAETSGAPIIRGLMWDHPSDPHSGGEDYKNQFFLGQSILIAPVYQSQASSKGWRENIYLPQGIWFDYFDGTVINTLDGGTTVNRPVTLEQLPVLIKAGAIIPMYPEALYDGQVAKDVVTFDIYPHLDNEFELYEDDGNTRQYRQGAYSSQNIQVSAPAFGQRGDITVKLGAVVGHYQGQLNQRAYELLLRTHVKPSLVVIDGKTSNDWHYDLANNQGTLTITIDKAAITRPHEVKVTLPTAATPTKPYPPMPDYGSAMSMSALKLISRPLEESGYPFEKAIDDDPSTWFRTSRDQSLYVGAHEFVLYLGERTEITGFDIQGRTDKWWQYGQVKDFEIYMSDVNGDWGEPAYIGRLSHSKDKQAVRFDPIVGRMLRFRALSLHDPEGKDTAQPNPQTQNGPYNAMEPKKFGSWSVSEFKLHQYQPPKHKPSKRYLSALDAVESKGKVSKNSSVSLTPMVMNGLSFNKGLGVYGATTVNYSLNGNWQLFRADVGIDDSCQNPDGMRFQVWGDERMLFDSGNIVKPAVVKPELDIRGIKRLSLRSVDGDVAGCGNWANAMIIGYPDNTTTQGSRHE